MRRFALFVVCFVILFLVVFPVCAAGQYYDLPELGLNILISTDYDVFTRDISASDPLLKKYNFDEKTLMNQMVAANIYLDALSRVREEEIVITMVDSDFSNMIDLPDAFIESLSDMLAKEMGDNGLVVTSCSTYKHNQEKYVCMYYHDSAKTDYVVQYYTIVNSKAINIVLHSYQGTINSNQDQAIRSVVNSAKFSNTRTSDVVILSPAFEFADKESGVQFTVPDGWKQEPLSEEREIIKAKFTSDVNPGISILYGSADIWSQMPTSNRKGYSRSTFNNESFSTEEIAELVGENYNYISTIKLGRKEYFYMETESTTEVFGVPLKLKMIQMIRIENGWMFLFGFCGDERSVQYSEFEKMVGEVSYPTGGTSLDIPVMAFVVFAIVIVTAVLLLIYSINSKRKKDEYTEKVQNTGNMISKLSSFSLPTVQEPCESPEEICFCHMCGVKLPTGSEFCYKCGTKIIKE